MIKETIDVIDALISTELNLIGLVERVYKFTDPQQIYPAKYLGSGQYRNVDLVNCSYHRLNGAQSSSESESREGCGVDLKITQPMRMIVSCSKGILGSDDDMSVIKLATNLRSEMSFSNNKTLVTLLKVDYVSVIVNSVDFDSVSVWNDEFQNVDYSLDSSKCLIAFDYTIEIKGDKDCYVYECN